MTRILFFCLFLFPAQVFSQNAAEIYEQGLTLKKNKKTKEALVKFQEALKLNPSYYQAQYEIGWCYNDLQNYAAAITALRSVRKEMSTIAKLYFELGYAFEKSAQYDSARANYEKCKSLKPDYSNINKRIGYCYYSQDKHELALSKFIEHSNQKAVDSDYVYWYRRGYTENALKKFEDAIKSLTYSKLYKDDYLNTYLELGFANSKLKQDEVAIGYFNKAMELDPKSHVPYNGIAEIYRDNKKDMIKAMEWYQKTLTLKPNERKACFGIGYCLNSQQKYAEAVSYLTKAIEQENIYTAAYVELGYSYYKLGKNTEAETHFLKAISLNPSNENARFYLGYLYISQNNKQKAQQMANELKSLNSKNAAPLQEKINKL